MMAASGRVVPTRTPRPWTGAASGTSTCHRHTQLPWDLCWQRWRVARVDGSVLASEDVL